jgi:hypothetical protein
MVYRGASAAARLQLGERWRVRPSLELLHRLGGLIGPENVRMEYGASGVAPAMARPSRAGMSPPRSWVPPGCVPL